MAEKFDSQETSCYENVIDYYVMFIHLIPWNFFTWKDNVIYFDLNDLRKFRK